MSKIRVISDKDGILRRGYMCDVNMLLEVYISDRKENKSLCNWLCSIPIPDAVDYVAKDWGIEYEFC